jgi:hypothetical protein
MLPSCHGSSLNVNAGGTVHEVENEADKLNRDKGVRCESLGREVAVAVVSVAAMSPCWSSRGLTTRKATN